MFYNVYLCIFYLLSLLYVLLKKFIESLQNSYGVLKMKDGENIRWFGKIFVCQRRKVVLASGPYLMFPKHYVLNCSGILELRIPCGPTSCGINTVRGIDLKLWNGREGHRFGRECCRPGIALIKRSGRNLGVASQAYGMII
uniref:Putative ovule protein n=1 Tax=Solanum chacoense TaxID=4108 RepID=A0A0V0I3F4_SOLCH